MTDDKIYMQPSELVPTTDAARDAGKTIVFGNGCFDLVHVGHVSYLEAARALGDLLIVGINTDASIKRIKPDRPTPTAEDERFRVVAALQAVDYVVPIDEDIPFGLIELFRPHVQAKGTDYNLDKMPERELVERYGGRIEFVGCPKVRSATEIRQSFVKNA